MDIISEILQQLGNKPLWENWYIKERIGIGAFSEVYRVEAVRQSRTDVSALKIEPITANGKIFTNEAQKRSTLEQQKKIIENESKIMYSLKNCPNIVQYEEELIRELYINGSFEGYYFLIRMELLTNVYDMMTKTYSFDFSESNVMKLALDICQGLKAAHDINVIHRDIKPANFFVSANGTYKLGDFNISKQTTSTRSFAGTDGYIAPEVYRVKNDAFSSYTKQADIYSLGICLYQMMNKGLFPFENDGYSTDDAIDMRMKNYPFKEPINASPAFAAIIMKACKYDIMHRYQTIDEMISDINTAMNGGNSYSNPSNNRNSYDPNRTQYAESSNYQQQQYPPGSYTPPPAPPVTPPVNPPYNQNYNSPIPHDPPSKEKNYNWVMLLIVLLLFAIVLALAGIIFMGNRGNSSEDEENSTDSAFVSPDFAANMAGNANNEIEESLEGNPEDAEMLETEPIDELTEPAEETTIEPQTETTTEVTTITTTVITTTAATTTKAVVTTTEIKILSVSSDYGIVITQNDPLNMRSKPSKSDTVLCKVPKGAGVDIIGETGDWYYASYNGYTGYLSKEYVQLSYDVSKSDFGIIATSQDPLSMRESASKDSEIIYKVPLGAGVRILGEEGDFYYASYECFEEDDYFYISGYLSKDYILRSLEIVSFSDTSCTINSSGVSAYSTRYVALGERKSTITDNLPSKTKAIAKHMCTSYDVVWYELWSSDGKTYYGWVDMNFLDFD